MRIVIATCTVDYSGRLSAHLDPAKRVIMLKGDGSVLIHSEGGSYKPLNWMTAPCTVSTGEPGEDEEGVEQVWTVQADKTDDKLIIRIHEVIADVSEDLGVDPGLVKDGVEAHLQELLAEQVPQILGEGWELVRREFPTPVGPVDLMVRDADGAHVAIEVKRRGPLLGDVTGIFAAQEITKQARTLAEDRGIRCVVLDYDAMRGVDDPESRLF